MIRFIDLFCGIGGFRIAAIQAALSLNKPARCVMSSDIDPKCKEVYARNFGEEPLGDISQISSVPDHDLLLGGFPCQPFSIIGDRQGFDDVRGTLFFEIARILKEKVPKFFVLENVKALRGHAKGATLARIKEVLTSQELGYNVQCKVLNALDFGLPQRRERIFIVGSKQPLDNFQWPVGQSAMKPLDEILETDVNPTFFASKKIQDARRARLRRDLNRKRIPSYNKPSIWHENKSGNISVKDHSCALRAGASYNYLLVDGERRLTPKEMLRLQGFPENFIIPDSISYSQARKQLGNSLPVPVATEVIKALLTLE